MDWGKTSELSFTSRESRDLAGFKLCHVGRQNRKLRAWHLCRELGSVYVALGHADAPNEQFPFLAWLHQLDVVVGRDAFFWNSHHVVVHLNR